MKYKVFSKGNTTFLFNRRRSSSISLQPVPRAIVRKGDPGCKVVPLVPVAVPMAVFRVPKLFRDSYGSYGFCGSYGSHGCPNGCIQNPNAIP